MKNSKRGNVNPNKRLRQGQEPTLDDRLLQLKKVYQEKLQAENAFDAYVHTLIQEGYSLGIVGRVIDYTPPGVKRVVSRGRKLT